MKRLLLLLVASVSLACCTPPYVEPPVPTPTPTPTPQPSPVPPTPPRPIENIEGIAVGDDIAAVEAKVGQPYKTHTQIDPPHHEVRSYVLLDKNGEQAFLHLHVEGGKVVQVVLR